MNQERKSIWQEKEKPLSFSTLTSDLETEVAIIGAGITGITTAYLLAKSGVKVTVLESQEVGLGMTGFSTGHLTASLDADLSFISSRFNKETASAVALSMQDAIYLVEQICRDENINCHYKRVSAYQYTEDENQIKQVEEEAQASAEAGLAASLIPTTPLPFPVKRAFEIHNQAEFNALLHVQELASRVVKLGGQIFEHTHVTDVDDSDPCVITTREGRKVKAQKVVLATHTPIQFNIVQTELMPYRSYAIAVLLNDQALKPGLYWDSLEFYHYIRTYELQGKQYVIVGGEDHKVGESHFDENKQLDLLEQYTREKFDVAEVTHRWSAEHYMSVDGLPFIGKSPFGKNKFIATGFAGDGLTFGVVSAMVLSDLLTGKENKLAEIYTPGRFHPVAAAGDFLQQNFEFLVRFVKDRFESEASSIEEIKPGEGKIVKINGQQLAVFRDENDQVHTLSPVCTHMKCIVHWNDAERSWDCPCHGGRFSATGEVLNGPPAHGLEKKDVKAIV